MIGEWLGLETSIELNQVLGWQAEAAPHHRTALSARALLDADLYDNHDSGLY